MSVRILSVGSGNPRVLVIAYLVRRAQKRNQPSLDDQLRAALPTAMWIAYSYAEGELLSTTETRARRAGWPGGPLVLIGYGDGVIVGLHHRLASGADPVAVLAIDGLRSPRDGGFEHLELWRRVFDSARRGEILFVATAAPGGVDAPGRPPTKPTLLTLRELTGWPLAVAGHLPLGDETSEGSAHVHSYSADVPEGNPHVYQLLTALPALVRYHLVPWLARYAAGEEAEPATPRDPRYSDMPIYHPDAGRPLRRGDHGDDVAAWQARLHELGYDAGVTDGLFLGVTEHATQEFQRAAGLRATGLVDAETREAAARSSWNTVRMPSAVPRADPEAPRRLGLAVLARAEADLAAGVREDAEGYSPRIAQYLEGTGAEPAPHLRWGAAAHRRWIREGATQLGVGRPIQGSVAAKGTIAQLQRAGRWISAEDLRRDPRRVRPGMIAGWHRGPRDAPTGTLSLVRHVNLGGSPWRFGAIGYVDGAVSELLHNLGDDYLIGAGWLD